MNTPQIDALFNEIAALRNSQASYRENHNMLAQENERLKKSRDNYYKAAELQDELLTVRKELETERMRLAAVATVACADTKSSRTSARNMHPDYRSAALSDVERRVDECIDLRERVAALVNECNEKSRRIKALCEENAVLEKRINERHFDCNYHMNALVRLCQFVKPKDTSSAGVVQATIDWIKALLEDHEKTQAAFRKLRDEKDALLKWKEQAMVVDRQIFSVADYVRSHPDTRIGDDIWSLVGKWLTERDYLKRKLQEIKKLSE